MACMNLLRDHKACLIGGAGHLHVCARVRAWARWQGVCSSDTVPAWYLSCSMHADASCSGQSRQKGSGMSGAAHVCPELHVVMPASEPVEQPIKPMAMHSQRHPHISTLQPESKHGYNRLRPSLVSTRGPGVLCSALQFFSFGQGAPTLVMLSE
jgi:hypothetical protein